LGVDQADADVQQRTARCQPVVTAVISHRHVSDGLEVVGQEPHALKEERASLEAPSKASDEPREEARKSVLERLPHRQHRVEDRKRPELARALVQQREDEGQFPQAHDACDPGVLNLDGPRDRERRHQPGVREVACSRHRPGYGPWRRVDVVAAERTRDHPERVRPVTVQCRHGERNPVWAFTKTRRLKRSGRKRLVRVHEKQEWTDIPRVLVTDAWHGEHGRGSETWSDRWAAEILPAFGKQVPGVEAAQVRQADAVTRHVRVSGVAPSMVQRAPAGASTSERSAVAEAQMTSGQPCRAIGREVMRSVLELIKQLLAAGQSCEDV
jgi:hypothetical protein